jgi:hypothetical protein
MRRILILFGLILAIPFVASAQDASKFELFGGYTYARVFDSSGSISNSNGGAGDVGFFPLSWAGLVGDVGYSHSSGYTFQGTPFKAPTDALHYFGGPRVRFGSGRFQPYVQTLFGVVHRSNLETSGGVEISGPENSFAYLIGGGVDLKIFHHVSIRLIQASYLRTVFTPTTFGFSASQNGLDLTTGIVIH